MISRVAGGIDFGVGHSVYLLIPKDVEQKMKRSFGVDPRDKNVTKACSLEFEKAVNSPETLKLIIRYELIVPHKVFTEADLNETQ